MLESLRCAQLRQRYGALGEAFEDVKIEFAPLRKDERGIDAIAGERGSRADA